MDESAKRYPVYLDGLRYFCALMLYFYGVSKLLGGQFTTPPEVAHRPIGSLNGYTLTWFYYGYSTGYRWILGLTQIAGASLLLFRRSALMGAMAMVPVMANILLINIFYKIAFGAECMAAVLLASLVLLLWHQRVELVHLLWSAQAMETAGTRKYHWAVRGVIFAMILFMVFVFWEHHR